MAQEKKTGNDIELASDLYAFLGFGTLCFKSFHEGLVLSKNSHYVKGWKCGSVQVQGTVCRVTEGFIEGASKAIFGKDISVIETQCMNQGHDSCEFQIDHLDEAKYDFDLPKKGQFIPHDDHLVPEIQSHIDKQVIVETVLGMPLEANNEGLIPAFNVYLAHTPQDFYNLICINFVHEMSKHNLSEVAQEMLVEDAENCALNTFGGILDSEEWASLIKPMVKEQRDVLFGLVAVANALGWGHINIAEHTPYKSLELVSCNGYEACGYLEFIGNATFGQCFMLKGIASGLMGLVYEKGDLEDRVGKYHSDEILCLTKKDNLCHFKVKI